MPLASPPSDDIINAVKVTFDAVLDPAGLSLERARLFLLEEPATTSDPDILLVVVYTALGGCLPVTNPPLHDIYIAQAEFVLMRRR